MKRKFISPVVALLGLSFIFFTAFMNTDNPAGSFQYVGVDKCATVCHKGDTKGNQYEIWSGSKHSQAFKDLQTPDADKLAKDKGYSTPAAETPQCVKCHVLGKDIDATELMDTFDKTQGVQCETCHGPGSEYKKISIMKDLDQAKQNGLVVHTEGASFCVTCHNPDSPSYKDFNYDDYWGKIKHLDPNLHK